MRSQRSNFSFFEDLVKMAGNASGALPDVSMQIKAIVKDRINDVLGELDLVTRSEFERVELIAQRARERQEQLEKRVVTLEKKLSAKNTPAKPVSAKTKRTKK